ncbi:MAG TPA: tRNA (N(6)-L-threonylcarbamoyladenosine(37)-C(2))-methylthiotransferase MtaB [Candidatus Acidoferrum sp.]|nr:tRNA (N(6)-L-threonylcarbamoyladenosine(37)-C(2))-methylthiotransferase MtaB [Candidatus Acidoferrum sp.]
MIFMPTVAFDTLGCKVNQYETEVMRAGFEAAGYTTVPFSQAADVYIVNTCSVTAASDAKSRQALRRARRLSPTAVIAAVGCYAQVAADELSALPEVNLVLGSVGKTALPAVIEAYRRDGTLPAVTPLTRPVPFEPMEAARYLRTRAVMKIQDGCNNFCAYCIIPYARGRIRSKRPDDALAEFSRLVAEGYREIILTGIEIASYGGGEGEAFDLEGLLGRMAGVPGADGVRVRLGSLEPRIVTPSFAKTLSELPFICPQFHLSLQAGCDATLRRMNRRYDKARYLESVALLREAMPGTELTTDVIVGFPGETEADFLESVAFVQTVGFLKTHVFPYSRRPGTPAADMPEQIPVPERERRAAMLSQAAEEVRRQRLAAAVGQTRQVLLEARRGDAWHGYTASYMPVYAKGPGAHNTFADVTLVELEADGLAGVIR